MGSTAWTVGWKPSWMRSEMRLLLPTPAAPWPPQSGEEKSAPEGHTKKKPRKPMSGTERVGKTASVQIPPKTKRRNPSRLRGTHPGHHRRPASPARQATMSTQRAPPPLPAPFPHPPSAFSHPAATNIRSPTRTRRTRSFMPPSVGCGSVAHPGEEWSGSSKRGGQTHQPGHHGGQAKLQAARTGGLWCCRCWRGRSGVGRGTPTALLPRPARCAAGTSPAPRSPSRTAGRERCQRRCGRGPAVRAATARGGDGQPIGVGTTAPRGSRRDSPPFWGAAIGRPRNETTANNQ